MGFLVNGEGGRGDAGGNDVSSGSSVKQATARRRAVFLACECRHYGRGSGGIPLLFEFF